MSKSFTGDKLDWMTALSADPRLDARAFEVGFCIAQHINAKSGRAIVSDDTISDKTSIPKRWVLRARQSLRDAGWIDWQRTRTANVYWTLTNKLTAIPIGKIYFLRAGENGDIKIGFTKGPIPDRMKSIQTGCPSRLIFLGAMDGSQQDERQLHRKFAKYSVSGEWFTANDDLLFYIMNLSTL